MLSQKSMLHPTSFGCQGYENTLAGRAADASKFIRELSESSPLPRSIVSWKMVNEVAHARCQKGRLEVETIMKMDTISIQTTHGCVSREFVMSLGF
jgi:hypothetical protein